MSIFEDLPELPEILTLEQTVNQIIQRPTTNQSHVNKDEDRNIITSTNPLINSGSISDHSVYATGNLQPTKFGWLSLNNLDTFRSLYNK